MAAGVFHGSFSEAYRAFDGQGISMAGPNDWS